MSRRKLLFDLLMLTLLAVGVTALNAHWAAVNQAPPASDDSSHMTTSLELLRHVSEIGPLRALSLLLLYPHHYPPLAYQSTLLAYGMLGPGMVAAIVSFFPFLLVMAWSMYGIGAGIAGRAVGYVCALAALTSPVVLDHARTYFLDLPATAMLAASLCTLMYSRNFTHRGWSVLFGVSMAFGVLSKWTHPVFLLPFIAWSVIAALRDTWRQRSAGLVAGLLLANTWLLLVLYVLYAPVHDDLRTFQRGPWFSWLRWGLGTAVALGFAWALQGAARRRVHLRPLANLLEAFVASVAIAWPWYYYNGDKVREKIVYQAAVQVDLDLGLRMYVGDISHMLYLAPLLVGLGLIVGLARPRLRLWTLLLASSCALSVYLSALLPPDSRYLMPVVVLVVPLGLAWTAHVGRGSFAVQAVVLTAVSLVCVFQACDFELRRAGQPTLSGPLRAGARGTWTMPLYLGLRPVVPALPQQGSWPYDEVMKALRSGIAEEYIWVAVLESGDDSARLQPRTFLYQAALLGERLFVIETADGLERGGEVHDIENVKRILLIYRQTSSRKQLLEEAVKRGWLREGAAPLRGFDFSPDFRVEIFEASHIASPAGT